MKRYPKQGELYRHFKNKLYQVMAVATHSETGESMVVYQALYGTFKMYVRPLEMFMSEVDHAKYPDVQQKYRFQQVYITDSGETELVEEEELCLKPVQKKTCLKPVKENTQGINPFLLEFLEAEGYGKKIEILQTRKKHWTEPLLQTMGMSLDFPVGEGNIEEQYDALLFYLSTHAKYEGNRLR